MNTKEILARGGAFGDLEAEGDIDAALAAMPDALVERGSVVGSLEHVRTRLDEFASVGVTDVVLDGRGLPADSDGIRELLETLK
jgi:alkanesulfonate monooxygenase SsuD/methylene tetrahydromethanopterin reductase-like flavin-dependent oxidoreductase (luciferase family)